MELKVDTDIPVVVNLRCVPKRMDMPVDITNLSPHLCGVDRAVAQPIILIAPEPMNLLHNMKIPMDWVSIVVTHNKLNILALNLSGIPQPSIREG